MRSTECSCCARSCSGRAKSPNSSTLILNCRRELRESMPSPEAVCHRSILHQQGHDQDGGDFRLFIDEVHYDAFGLTSISVVHIALPMLDDFMHQLHRPPGQVQPNRCFIRSLWQSSKNRLWLQPTSFRSATWSGAQSIRWRPSVSDLEFSIWLDWADLQWRCFEHQFFRSDKGKMMQQG